MLFAHIRTHPQHAVSSTHAMCCVRLFVCDYPCAAYGVYTQCEQLRRQDKVCEREKECNTNDSDSGVLCVYEIFGCTHSIHAQMPPTKLTYRTDYTDVERLCVILK